MKSIFTILLLLLLKPAFTQNLLRFEHIGAKEGLSNQNVNCIFQDDKGFMWFGTDFGLNRFDGISCKTFYHKPGDTTSLAHNTVIHIIQSPDHKLWVSTQEGVSIWDPQLQHFTNYSAQGKGIYFYPKENCHSFIDKNGTIWIGHNAGVSYFDTQQKRFVDISLELGAPGSKRNRFTSGFLHDSKNRLWVSTSYGIYQIDLQTKQVKNFHFGPEPSGEFNLSNACQQIVEDRKGRIFTGTWNAGLDYFDEATQQLKTRLVSPLFPENVIGSIMPVVENNKDYLLLGTLGGLLKIETDEIFSSKKTLTLDKNVPDKINRESISHTSIYSIYFDRSGNLWVGSGNGVNKADPLQQYFHHARINNSPSLEFTPDAIAPSFDHKTYFIVAGPQLYRYDPATLAVKQIDFLPGYDISEIARGKKNYWAGSDHGLFQCDTAMRMIRHWQPSFSNGSFINFVMEDHEQKIWFTPWKSGIAKLDPVSGTIQRYLYDSTQPYNLSGQPVEEIMEDRKHNIWIASAAGLFRFNRTNNTFTQYLINEHIGNTVNNCTSIIESKTGTIWVGTKQGLDYYDEKLDKLVSNPFKNPEISDYITAIKEDNENLLWLTTINGLIRFNPATQQIRLFNTTDGLPSNEMTGLFTDDDAGRIYIGSPGIITSFDPLAIKKNNFVPQPVITNISINNNIITRNNAALKIRYNQTLSVDFVSLNYSNTAANQYAYQLKGIDRDWISLGNNRSVRFSSLPAGDYTLKIKAANTDGVWNDQTTDLHFTVTPPFWKTWWFISLLVALVIAAVYALYRYRVTQLLRMEKMRTRIATDLHDDIGATLSSISFYSEAVKEQVKEKLPHLQPVLEKMGENSRSMVGSMSDIVWAINPDNDEGEKLLQRMEAYAKDLCSVKNVSLVFNADEKIRTLKLPLEQRKNIYLLFKESLNNALKYAECSVIHISFSIHDSSLHLYIKDNGKGFDPEKIKKGNGLKNMSLRAAEINGKLKVITEDGKGTAISLESPIA